MSADDDDVWGTEVTTGTRDYAILTESFTTAGYREGITAGKEAALQLGFDQGFSSVGVPMGRRLGNLRGVAAGLLSHILKDGHSQEHEEEVKAIIARLACFQLTTLAPLDLEALEHAKEPLDQQDASLLDIPSSDHSKASLTELTSLRDRLTILAVNMKICLDIPECSD